MRNSLSEALTQASVCRQNLAGTNGGTQLSERAINLRTPVAPRLHSRIAPPADFLAKSATICLRPTASHAGRSTLGCALDAALRAVEMDAKNETARLARTAVARLAAQMLDVSALPKRKRKKTIDDPSPPPAKRTRVRSNTKVPRKAAATSDDNPTLTSTLDAPLDSTNVSAADASIATADNHVDPPTPPSPSLPSPHRAADAPAPATPDDATCCLPPPSHTMAPICAYRADDDACGDRNTCRCQDDDGSSPSADAVAPTGAAAAPVAGTRPAGAADGNVPSDEVPAVAHPTPAVACGAARCRRAAGATIAPQADGNRPTPRSCGARALSPPTSVDGTGTTARGGGGDGGGGVGVTAAGDAVDTSPSPCDDALAGAPSTPSAPTAPTAPAVDSDPSDAGCAAARATPRGGTSVPACTALCAPSSAAAAAAPGAGVRPTEPQVGRIADAGGTPPADAADTPPAESCGDGHPVAVSARPHDAPPPSPPAGPGAASAAATATATEHVDGPHTSAPCGPAAFAGDGATAPPAGAPLLAASASASAPPHRVDMAALLPPCTTTPAPPRGGTCLLLCSSVGDHGASALLDHAPIADHAPMAGHAPYGLLSPTGGYALVPYGPLCASGGGGYDDEALRAAAMDDEYPYVDDDVLSVAALVDRRAGLRAHQGAAAASSFPAPPAHHAVVVRATGRAGRRVGRRECAATATATATEGGEGGVGRAASTASPGVLPAGGGGVAPTADGGAAVCAAGGDATGHAGCPPPSSDGLPFHAAADHRHSGAYRDCGVAPTGARAEADAAAMPLGLGLGCHASTPAAHSAAAGALYVAAADDATYGPAPDPAADGACGAVGEYGDGGADLDDVAAVAHAVRDAVAAFAHVDTGCTHVSSYRAVAAAERRLAGPPPRTPPRAGRARVARLHPPHLPSGAPPALWPEGGPIGAALWSALAGASGVSEAPASLPTASMAAMPPPPRPVLRRGAPSRGGGGFGAAPGAPYGAITPDGTQSAHGPLTAPPALYGASFQFPSGGLSPPPAVSVVGSARGHALGIHNGTAVSGAAIRSATRRQAPGAAPAATRAGPATPPPLGRRLQAPPRSYAVVDPRERARRLLDQLAQARHGETTLDITYQQLPLRSYRTQ